MLIEGYRAVSSLVEHTDDVGFEKIHVRLEEEHIASDESFCSLFWGREDFCYRDSVICEVYFCSFGLFYTLTDI